MDKISVGMISMPHSFTNDVLAYATALYSDNNAIPPYSSTHSLMFQSPIAAAQIVNADYSRRVKHLASLIHCKRWKVTLIYMLADEFFGGYESGINKWPGPRDGSSSGPGGNYTKAIDGPDTLLAELDKLSGEPGRYLFTYDKAAGYLHGHFKIRTKFSKSGPVADYGLGDDDEWWTNPMSNMILIDTHYIYHVNEVSPGFDEQQTYADGGVVLPWWLLDNYRLEQPAYAGGLPYDKETVWDQAMILSKLNIKDEIGSNQTIIVGMLQVPSKGLLGGIQQYHIGLNMQGEIPIPGYPYDPPYEESFENLFNDIGRIPEKYIELVSRAKSLSGDTPLLLFVEDQFQAVDPTILGFDKLPFEPNMIYNETMSFGKSDGLTGNPHDILEGQQIQSSGAMYAISKNITATPIKTEFPGTIDICPTAKIEGIGPDVKMKLVEESSTIYANSKVSYETVISLDIPKSPNKKGKHKTAKQKNEKKAKKAKKDKNKRSKLPIKK
eukprot:CAMPEP_0194269432 /NCGR_PEP_ID=MMETSP0169-20130528/3594_1 /TAXON_ID=218684 /ORGANISM="Corethron pennatum, Strain L29A3" /LENGTH=495 /DNA_ID=CAMNT_0039011075 /DNA_START=181 /DNA_END=1668 /DNA_ORIENTATION=-